MVAKVCKAQSLHPHQHRCGVYRERLPGLVARACLALHQLRHRHHRSMLRWSLQQERVPKGLRHIALAKHRLAQHRNPRQHHLRSSAMWYSSVVLHERVASRSLQRLVVRLLWSRPTVHQRGGSIKRPLPILQRRGDELLQGVLPKRFQTVWGVSRLLHGGDAVKSLRAVAVCRQHVCAVSCSHTSPAHPQVRRRDRNKDLTLTCPQAMTGP
mmetsp:Transcript_102670/g.229269  ORF Transcript_102670/g.229269 Transcript_102670/m.229269 type:complete len:212 (+) Transcript_102670:1373-2008(+)